MNYAITMSNGETVRMHVDTSCGSDRVKYVDAQGHRYATVYTVAVCRYRADDCAKALVRTIGADWRDIVNVTEVK